MISALLLVAQIPSEPVSILPVMTPAEADLFLRTLGVPIEKSHPKDRTNRIKISDGTTMDLSVNWEPGSDGKPDIARQFNVTFRYLPTRKLTPGLVQSISPFGDMGGPPVSIQTYLSGVITFHDRISLDGVTDFGVRRRLKELIAYASQLTSEYPPAPADAKPFPVDEDQKVDCLHFEDLAYLMASWNWTYPYGMGFSGPVIPTVGKIDGVVVFMSQPHPGFLIRDRIALSAQGTATDAKVNLVQLAKQNIKMIQNEGEPKVTFTSEIDLAGGMKLKDFKARLREFAKSVKPYFTQADAKAFK